MSTDGFFLLKQVLSLLTKTKSDSSINILFVFLAENKNTSFELRSEEVQEILTRVPHWLIRWGSVVVFNNFSNAFTCFLDC